MIRTKDRVMTIAAAFALVPLALLAGGCAAHLSDTYAQSQLEQARTAYETAKADPHIEATAGGLLLDANMALQEAEKTGDADKVTSLAYVAQRKVQTARTLTEGKMAEAEFQRMSKVNTALVMQKREREARMAREEVQAKTQELERTRQQAQMTAQQAEQAKSQTEQARLDAERSRMASERARAEAMQAKTEQAELLRELSNIKATETERGLVLTLGDVLFETGKSNISPRAKNNLDKLAEFLNKYPDRNLMIEGYTDSVGSTSFNRQLAEQRADAVKEALAARGVDDDRVEIKGYGEAHPVATNKTAHGRQLNRRVEVIILHEGAAGGQVSPESGTGGFRR